MKRDSDAQVWQLCITMNIILYYMWGVFSQRYVQTHQWVRVQSSAVNEIVIAIIKRITV